MLGVNGGWRSTVNFETAEQEDHLERAEPDHVQIYARQRRLDGCRSVAVLPRDSEMR